MSKVLVREGDQVKSGQTLAIIEAMKMEVSVAAPMDAKISKIEVKEGQSVRAGELLMTLS